MNVRMLLALACVAYACTACTASPPPAVGNAFAGGVEASAGATIFRDAIDSGVAPTALSISLWRTWSARMSAREPTQALRFAQQSNLVAVVGHPGSRDALLAAVVYNREHVPHVVPTATSRQLAQSGPWTFPLAPNGDAEGQFIADFAVDSLHASRTSVLYLPDEYGVGIRDGINARLAARGRAVVDQSAMTADPCGNEMSAIVVRAIVRASIHRAHPDVVVLATSGSNTSCIINEVLLNAPATRFICADGIEMNAELFNALSPAARAAAWRVAFWVPGTDSVTAAFVARTRRLLHRDPRPSDAATYDAFMAVSAAVQAVGPHRDAVRRWLASLGVSRPPLPGITGPITFNGTRAHMLHMVPFLP